MGLLPEQKYQIDMMVKPIKTPGHGRSLLTSRNKSHEFFNGTEHVLLEYKSAWDIEYVYFILSDSKPPISMKPNMVTIIDPTIIINAWIKSVHITAVKPPIDENTAAITIKIIIDK